MTSVQPSGDENESPVAKARTDTLYYAPAQPFPRFRRLVFWVFYPLEFVIVMYEGCCVALLLALAYEKEQWIAAIVPEGVGGILDLSTTNGVFLAVVLSGILSAFSAYVLNTRKALAIDCLHLAIGTLGLGLVYIAIGLFGSQAASIGWLFRSHPPWLTYGSGFCLVSCGLICIWCVESHYVARASSVGVVAFAALWAGWITEAIYLLLT